MKEFLTLSHIPRKVKSLPGQVDRFQRFADVLVPLPAAPSTHCVHLTFIVRGTGSADKTCAGHDALRSGSGYLMREWYSAISPLHNASSMMCSSVSVRPDSSNWP